MEILRKRARRKERSERWRLMRMIVFVRGLDHEI
jgi:cytochrome c oxidase assembly factor CtaG